MTLEVGLSNKLCRNHKWIKLAFGMRTTYSQRYIVLKGFTSSKTVLAL